jgi:hypothetical protein
VPGPRGAGHFDIADIVRAHRAELESGRTLSHEQRRVLTDIANCRTAKLGGHVDQCVTCGYEHPAYNSCRNRHCPKCPALAQDKWIALQRARMLDVKHFHVVFTLPAELRALAAFHPRVVFDALFFAAGRTLLEFGESRLAAKIGATLVLHTWTRDLRFHPHVHAIVTGGGLALDAEEWRASRRNFLFPVKAMGRVFRGKMKARLREAYDEDAFDRFHAFQDPQGFDQLLRSTATKNWNVYAKPSFDRGEHVLQYLGRYTHRVGIANSRLLDVTRDAVTFGTKDSRTATLRPVDFLARFVQHVLPIGFHKIRHVGLHASVGQRDAARHVLGTPPLAPPALTWRERLEKLTGREISVCPRCGGLLVAVAIPSPLARSPPMEAA